MYATNPTASPSPTTASSGAKAPCAARLDEIPGIGESYQKRLLNHFGSVKAMREASVEDFEKVKGIGHAKAEALYNACTSSEPARSSSPE